MSKDFYTASELADLGYVSERLTSVFGEPDSVDGGAALGRATPLLPSSGTYPLQLAISPKHLTSPTPGTALNDQR
ncbi:hypothetical protein [Rhodococcus erythropolis]|uniref:hypothetical protein n=1 Tax=Rhodococcus erythropolis TaxID=1833 RepID=UPI00031AE541|nr:hypothetical protein [Rhodococcus erythropolis]